MATTIPSFGLYGTAPEPDWQGMVHLERIPERARFYGWEIEPHRHDALLQLLCPMAGGGEIQIGQRVWAIAPPCLVLVPAGHVHSFHFTSDADGPVITVASEPVEKMLRIASPELAACLAEPAVLPMPEGEPNGHGMYALIEQLGRDSRTHVPQRAVVGMALMVALLAMVAQCIQASRVQEADPGSGAPVILRHFRSLLDQHWRDHWRVEHYARALGIAPGHLSRLCRRLQSGSALDAINQRVMHEARRELAYSSLPVKAVAHLLGYEDQAYFGRFFRKHAGVSPTRFRSQVHEQRLARSL